jgi:hypothetical protein
MEAQRSPPKERQVQGELRANELMMKITCPDLLNTHDVSKLDVELP